MSKIRKIILISLSIISTILLFTGTVFSSGINIGVSPLIIEIEANPGETVTELINIKTGVEEELMLSTIIKDFYYDESDQLQFISEQEAKDPDLKKFTLKSWLNVEKEVSVGGAQGIEVPVIINVPKDAAPGGRYAMVLFSKSGANINDNSGPNVGMGGQVGVMILVSVRGEFANTGGVSEDIKSGRLSEDRLSFAPKRIFASGSLFKNGPIDFKFRYKNDSATHIVPKGNITVKNLFGSVVDEFEIENKRVFPGVSRSVYGTLEKDFLFGIYNAKLNIVDGDGNAHTSKTFFIGFPVKIIMLIAILVGFIIIFFKYYNKWMINKYLQHNAKSSNKRKS